jgi:hypothetical protein
MVLCAQAVPRSYKECNWGQPSQFLRESMKKRVSRKSWESAGREPLFTDDLRTEAEKLVAPSCVYKWSINPIPNPNSVYSHSNT